MERLVGPIPCFNSWHVFLPTVERRNLLAPIVMVCVSRTVKNNTGRLQIS